LSHDISGGGGGGDSIDGRTECFGEYVELREGESESAVDRRVIAAMKWVLLTFVFIRMDKTKWGKVKSSTHILCRWQNILTITWGYWASKESHYTLPNVELSIRDET
jgi:hypothetical protein